MANKVFIYKHQVLLNETNAMGGVVYFSNYVKWQGLVREAFLIETVPEWKFLIQLANEGKLNMVTVEEHSRFIHHSFFGEEIVIRIHATELKKLSFKINFEMTKNNHPELIYTGWQKLSFDDCHGNFKPIPEPLFKSVLEHSPSEEVEKYTQTYCLVTEDQPVGID